MECTLLIQGAIRDQKLYAFERSGRERRGRFQGGTVHADNQARDARCSLATIMVRRLSGTGRHDSQRGQGDSCGGAYNSRLAPASTGSYGQMYW